MQVRYIVGIAIIIAIMGGITCFSAQTARESDAISRGIVKTVAIELNLLTEELPSFLSLRTTELFVRGTMIVLRTFLEYYIPSII